MVFTRRRPSGAAKRVQRRTRLPDWLLVGLIGFGAIAPNSSRLWADSQVLLESPRVDPTIHVLRSEDGTEFEITVPPGETRLQIAGEGAVLDLAEHSLESVRPTSRVSSSQSCVENWTNNGGNAGRNGQSSEVGPIGGGIVQLWPPIRVSIIAFHPFIEGSRVFVVRMKDVGSSASHEDSPVVALDLDSGEEIWFTHLPKNPGDWTTWIAGVSGGMVFVSRSGNGATVAAKIFGLDTATGEVVWESEDTVTAGWSDGVVFAPDGDLIVGSFTSLMRIDAVTGDTVWESPRICSVTGSCGAALGEDAVYVADTAGVSWGHKLVKFDLASGTREYDSPVMNPGCLTLQNTPMVGPDGTIFLSRTQDNPACNHFYAFNDSGSGFVEKWRVPAALTNFSEFGVGLDGSVYMVAPGHEFVRLDPATGAVTATAGLLPDFKSPRIAIDAIGNVYLSNQAFASGRLYVYAPDLTPAWSTPVTKINFGGPAIGRFGTLVVCGTGTDARAYRRVGASAACFIFGDGFETGNTSDWSDVEGDDYY